MLVSALSAGHAAFLFIPQTGNCQGFSMLLKSVRLAAGQRFRLPSGLFPCVFLFVFLLVGHCVRLASLVSLLVGHCLRLVSLLLPFVFLLVSLFVFLLVGHCVPLFPSVSLCLQSCLPSCWSLCPPCLPFVSFCFPSCFPFCFPFPSVSLCPQSCLPSCFSSCWSFYPPCLPSVFLCLRSCHPSSWSLCPPCLPSVSFCLLPSFGHCVRLVSLLFPFLFSLAILNICLPGLSCCVRLCHSLHLSPSSGLLCPPLPCNYTCLVSLLFTFLLVIVSALSPFSLSLSLVLLVVSVLSPFVSLLVSLLV